MPSTIKQTQELIGWRLLFQQFMANAWLDNLIKEWNPLPSAGSTSDNDDSSLSKNSENLCIPFEYTNGPTDNAKADTTPSNTLMFMAGLIKAVWQEMSKLWAQQLDI